MGINTDNVDPWLINMRDNCVLLETAVLNTMDKTIVLTMLSGNVREVFAVIQGIASLIFAVSYAHQSMNETGLARAKLQESAWFCVDMTKHAVLNYGRAKIASYYKVATIVPSAALIVYDWGLKDRIRYCGEREAPVQSWIANTYTQHFSEKVEHIGVYLGHLIQSPSTVNHKF